MREIEKRKNQKEWYSKNDYEQTRF